MRRLSFLPHLTLHTLLTYVTTARGRNRAEAGPYIGPPPVGRSLVRGLCLGSSHYDVTPCPPFCAQPTPYTNSQYGVVEVPVRKKCTYDENGFPLHDPYVLTHHVDREVPQWKLVIFEQQWVQSHHVEVQ
jgi:hypothetical protein